MKIIYVLKLILVVLALAVLGACSGSSSSNTGASKVSLNVSFKQTGGTATASKTAASQILSIAIQAIPANSTSPSGADIINVGSNGTPASSTLTGLLEGETYLFRITAYSSPTQTPANIIYTGQTVQTLSSDPMASNTVNLTCYSQSSFGTVEGVFLGTSSNDPTSQDSFTIDSSGHGQLTTSNSSWEMHMYLAATATPGIFKVNLFSRSLPSGAVQNIGNGTLNTSTGYADGTGSLASWTLLKPQASNFSAWSAITATNAPAVRGSATVVWTGTEFIVWGGTYFNSSTMVTTYYNDGGRYNPLTGNWASISTTNAPSARAYHSAIWTGTEMIVWGGYGGGGSLGDGAAYNPVSNSWTTLPTLNAPQARSDHKAVWTGSKMIIWGGVDFSTYLNSGAVYNPVAGTWTPVSTTGAPSGRSWFSNVWTGTEMIVWGGQWFNGTSNVPFNDGARYNPTTDTWTTVSASPLTARSAAATAWNGSKMFVWGGWDTNSTAYTDGALYDPVADTWTVLPTTGAPTHGDSDALAFDAGAGNILLSMPYSDAYYNAATNSWTYLGSTGKPTAGRVYTSRALGHSRLFMWGGSNSAMDTYYSNGGLLSR